MDGKTLEGYYKTIFNLTYHHKYSISELEDLPSFELEIYKDLFLEDIKQQQMEAEGFAIG